MVSVSLSAASGHGKTIIYAANTSWYLFNFRLELMRRMMERGWRVVAAAPPDMYSGALKKNGIEFIPVPMSRHGANPFKELTLLRNLYGIYKKRRPTLVHHFTIKPVIYGSLAARLAKVPAIVNAVTGLGYVFCSDELKSRISKPYVKFMYRLISRRENTRIIFQNPDDMSAFAALVSLNASKAALIRGSGVDTSRFTPGAEPEGMPVIVLCARMLWNKGVADLIAASRLLKKSGTRFQIILAGDTDPGNPDSIPKEQLLDWEWQGLVKWIGHTDEMSKVFAGSNIVALPSSYGEGVPRSLIEAAASGRPIVAYDVPGCREVVLHGKNGLLVPAGNAEALADALKKLLEDPGLRRRMGAHGRELAVNEFSLERVITETLQVYEELLVKLNTERNVKEFT